MSLIHRQSPITAGSGQVYDGELRKGILVLVGSVIGAFIFLIPGISVLVYGIYDSYVIAEKMNKGKVLYQEASAESVIAYILAYLAIIVMAIFIVIAVAPIIFGAVIGSIL